LSSSAIATRRTLRAGSLTGSTLPRMASTFSRQRLHATSCALPQSRSPSRRREGPCRGIQNNCRRRRLTRTGAGAAVGCHASAAAAAARAATRTRGTAVICNRCRQGTVTVATGRGRFSPAPANRSVPHGATRFPLQSARGTHEINTLVTSVLHHHVTGMLAAAAAVDAVTLLCEHHLATTTRSLTLIATAVCLFPWLPHRGGTRRASASASASLLEATPLLLRGQTLEAGATRGTAGTLMQRTST
jgi:hypothetical protein